MSVTLGKSFRRSSAHRDGTGIEYCFNDTPQHCAMPVPRLKQTSASLILCRQRPLATLHILLKTAARASASTLAKIRLGVTLVCPFDHLSSK